MKYFRGRIPAQIKHQNASQALLALQVTDQCDREKSHPGGLGSLGKSLWWLSDQTTIRKYKLSAIWDKSPNFSIPFFPFPQDLFAVNGPWNKGMCPSYASFDPSMQEEIKKHPAMSPWSLRWVINPTRGTLRRQLWRSSEELSCPLHPQERKKCTSEGAIPFLQLLFKMVSCFCSNAVLPKNQINSWNSSRQQLSVPKIHNW